jgi:hypothetical protein
MVVPEYGGSLLTFHFIINRKTFILLNNILRVLQAAH